MIALPGYFHAVGTVRARPARQVARVILATLEGWAERHRQRRALLDLDERMLKDIGLSRAEVYQEGMKPFWRA